MKHFSINRRNRSAPLYWEWFNWESAQFLTLGVGHRTRHAWWATGVTWYLPKWLARTPLARVPGTGYRSWRDSWAPMNPWRGKSRPWSRPEPTYESAEHYQSEFGPQW